MSLEKIAKNMDLFRKYYDQLTFSQLRKIHDVYFPKRFGNRIHWFPEFYGRCFDIITKKLGEELVVVEIGGSDGGLALEILKKYPKIEWLNLEVRHFKQKEELLDYTYKEYILGKHFWEDDNLNLDCHIMIFSDALEHFSNKDMDQIIPFILRHNIKFVAWETPLKEGSRTWKGSGSSHLLEYGRKYLRKRMVGAYSNIIDENCWKVKRYIKWCVLWERRELL